MKKLLVILLSLLMMASANAESGIVEFISMGTVEVKRNNFGDSEYSIFSQVYQGIVIKSEVSFLKANSINMSDCLGRSIKEIVGNKDDGTCLTIDSDGDKFRWNYNGGDSSLVGLTGKYADMSGTCNYELKNQVKDSVRFSMVVSKCKVIK